MLQLYAYKKTKMMIKHRINKSMEMNENARENQLAQIQAINFLFSSRVVISRILKRWKSLFSSVEKRERSEKAISRIVIRPEAL